MNNNESSYPNPEAADELSQLVLSGIGNSPLQSSSKRHKRRVAETLAQLRRIHDELNAQLYSLPTERPTIQRPQGAFEILRYFLGVLSHEEFWILSLDSRNRVIQLTKLYMGSVNSSPVRVAEVFRAAITDNAVSLILSHNHPSGDPTPSPEDIAVTRAAIQAGKLLEIDVLDHLIIANNHFISLKQRGLGFS